jgi:transposase
MDNLNLHKEEWVEQVVKSHGCAVLFLPPYSPETNPIELMFNMLKSSMRKAAPDGVVALNKALNQALDSITADVARAFFQHCHLSLPTQSSQLLLMA